MPLWLAFGQHRPSVICLRGRLVGSGLGLRLVCFWVALVFLGALGLLGLWFGCVRRRCWWDHATLVTHGGGKEGLGRQNQVLSFGRCGLETSLSLLSLLFLFVFLSYCV